jgi:hypothetical protein
MHQIEVVRLCALWDQAHIDNESIPTAIELINDPKVIDALAEQVRSQHDTMPTRFDKSADETPEVSTFIENSIKNAILVLVINRQSVRL